MKISGVFQVLMAGSHNVAGAKGVTISKHTARLVPSDAPTHAAENAALIAAGIETIAIETTEARLTERLKQGNVLPIAIEVGEVRNAEPGTGNAELKTETKPEEKAAKPQKK